GGIDEVHAGEIDDEALGALVDDGDETLPQPRCRRQVDLAADAYDRPVSGAGDIEAEIHERRPPGVGRTEVTAQADPRARRTPKPVWGAGSGRSTPKLRTSVPCRFTRHDPLLVVRNISPRPRRRCFRRTAAATSRRGARPHAPVAGTA